MSTEIKLEHQGTAKVHMWGGSKIVAQYLVTYRDDEYEVEATVRGLDSGFIELEFTDVLSNKDNNENTLSDDGVLEMLNDYIQGVL